VAEPDPFPESGELIGPYRIVRALSRGGMGEVFLGRDDRLNRWVAIKRIRHDSDTPALRQRLLQEARAVGSLSHPAIVLVYDLLKHEGDDCIVMEYVEGENLAQVLRRGPMGPALAVRLARTVASGLAAAHESGFIHRDLKAENVMITPGQDAKILDFGLAKPIGITGDDSSLTAVGSVVGTCRSMSPEQARGAGVDERSDLFSLGVLIYEMLTGSSPFQGSNALATLTKVISERPPCLDTLRPGLPPRLVALVFWLLAKEPDDRPQSAAEVARELNAIAVALSSSGTAALEETLTSLPTDAIRLWGGGGPKPPIGTLPPAATPPPDRVPQPRRRRLLEMAILSSLAMLAVGAVLFRLWWHEQPNPIQTATARAHPSSRQALPEPHRSVPSSPPALSVSPEDLAAFREIQQRIDAAEQPPQAEKELDQIIARSPGWLEARILAIDVAVSLFRSTKDAAYLDHAETLLHGANLPHDDPRLLPSQFKIELAAGRLPQAKRALSRLGGRDPGSPKLPELQAQWAEKIGRYEEALVDWKRAVESNRSWQNMLRLAKRELSFGAAHVKEARSLLEEIHRRSPENIYATQARAELELYYGDPAKAERLYRGLILRSPQIDSFTVNYRTNLGAALVLLGKYDEAAQVFNDALRFEPHDISTILNLADVEVARHHSDEARVYYDKALERLKWDHPDGKLNAADQMIQAQCMARLGDTREAMAIAEKTVQQNPGDATIVQGAALVFTLAGDRHALNYIGSAIAKGIQPRWFNFPSYDRLREDKTFQQLVNGKGRERGASIADP
jgi:serine/threonine protein kinase/tetratricopeptide (TPR) repeat protein